MNNVRRIALVLLLSLVPALSPARADEASRLAELDAFWTDVARCVKELDSQGYESTEAEWKALAK